MINPLADVVWFLFRGRAGGVNRIQCKAISGYTVIGGEPSY